MGISKKKSFLFRFLLLKDFITFLLSLIVQLQPCKTFFFKKKKMTSRKSHLRDKFATIEEISVENTRFFALLANY